MRIIINRNELLPALDLARRVAERGDGVLSCVFLRAEDGLHVVATDHEVAATSTVAATVAEDGTACAPASALHAVVAALPPGSDVEIAVVGKRLAVTWQRRRSFLPTIDPEEFPLVDDDVFAETVIPAHALREALQLAIPMASEDETRPAICGVSLRFDDDALVVTATDGKRVGQMRRACVRPGDGERLVTKRAAALMARICDAAGDAVIGFGDSWAGVTAGASRVVGRVGGDAFPDTSRVIPLRGGFDVSFAALDASLAAAAAIVDGDAVKLAPAGDKMSISADNFEDTVDVGEVLEQLPADGVGFNVRYLREAITACRGDVVEITGESSFGPFRFDASGDTTSDDVFVVMPMRL